MDLKQRAKSYVAKYRASHKEQILQRQRLKRKNFPLRRLVWNAKRRAKEKNLPFDLDESLLEKPTHCSYLGLELHYEGGKPREDNTASLDRIEPSKGYTQTNVEIISDLANRMKNSADINTLILFAEAVIKRFK